MTDRTTHGTATDGYRPHSHVRHSHVERHEVGAAIILSQTTVSHGGNA